MILIQQLTNGYDMEEQKLTREQRRKIERLNEDIAKFNRRLCEKYYNFFMDNDPDGFDISNLQSELSAKWKMYCGGFKITDEAALSSFDKYCIALQEKYHSIKNDKPQIPTESIITA